MPPQEALLDSILFALEEDQASAPDLDSILFALEGGQPASDLDSILSALGRENASKPDTFDEFLAKEKEAEARSGVEAAKTFGSNFLTGAEAMADEGMKAVGEIAGGKAGIVDVKRGLWDLGRHDFARFAETLGGAAMDKLGGYTDEEEKIREYNRYRDNFDYYQKVRPAILEATGTEAKALVGFLGEFADPTILLPVAGPALKGAAFVTKSARLAKLSKALEKGAEIVSLPARGVAAATRKGIKGGALVAGKLAGAAGAVGGGVAKAAGWPRRKLAQVAGGLVDEKAAGGALVGAQALGAMTGAVPGLGLLTGAEIAGYIANKTGKGIETILTTLAQPSGQLRFLERLARTADSPRIRKLALLAHKGKATAMGDAAFNMLVNGASVGTLNAALAYASGERAEGVGQAAGAGFVMGGAMPFGQPGQVGGKAQVSRDASSINFLEAKYADDQLRHFRKMPPEARLAFATVEEAGIPTPGVTFLDKKSMLELQRQTDPNARQAENAFLDERDNRIYVNQDGDFKKGGREAMEILFHELGHGFARQASRDDPFFLRTILREYEAEPGEKSHRFSFTKDPEGNPIDFIDVNEEGKAFADAYDAISPDPEVGVGDNANLLAHERAADQFAMMMADDPNFFRHVNPALRHKMVGAARNVLALFGVVNAHGNPLTVTIRGKKGNPMAQRSPAVRKLFRNYKKQREWAAADKADVAEKGTPLKLKKGETADKAVERLYGAQGLTLREAGAFVIRNKQIKNELKQMRDRIKDKPEGDWTVVRGRLLGKDLTDAMRAIFTRNDPRGTINVLINDIQEALRGKLQLNFLYRSGKPSKYGDHELKVRVVTPVGLEISGMAGRGAASLKMQAIDEAYLRNNVETLVREGLIDDPDAFIAKAREVAARAAEDPEGRINPEGKYENEMVTAALGHKESAPSIRNPKLRRLLEEGKLKHSFRSYEVGSLAGLAPTGRPGIGFNWDNIKFNYLPHDRQFLPREGAPGAAREGERLFMPAGDRPLGLSDNIRDVVLPGIKQDKFSRGQLEAALGKTAGARAYADEIGLIDWLKDRKSVTKSEVDAFVDANAPRLEEINSIGGEPRFSEYQEPGGTNYREVLVKLEAAKSIPERLDPSTTREDVVRVLADAMEAAKEYVLREHSALIDNLMRSDDVYATLREHVPNAEYRVAFENLTKEKRQDYHEPHFNEDNVLLHLRLNDRIDANGKKVLFIEELQSQWHQKGRKEGYDAPPSPRQEEVLRDRLKEIQKERELAHERKLPNRLRELEAEQTAINRKLLSVGVPDAPFKKNWPALGLKRAIKEAIEGGYDRIAWLDGEGQAARYDLSQHVDAVEIFRDGPDTFSIDVRPVGEMGGGFETLATKVPEKKLADYIGKEPAKKALEKQKDGIALLEGLDLKIGGEGMKAFYDRELVSIANKISKKIGGGKVRRERETKGWGGIHGDIPKSFIGSHVLDLPKNPQAVENLRLYMPAEKIPSDGRAPELIYEIDKKGQTMLPFKKGFAPKEEEATLFSKLVDEHRAEVGEPPLAEAPPPRDDWRAGNVRSKEAWGRDKLYMPAAPEDASPNTVSSWGDGDSPSFPAGYRRGQARSNEEVAKLFQEKYVERYGEPIDPYDYGPEAVEWLADMLASEGEGALKRTGSAVDWYTAAVERAMAIAEEIFPEIKTSAEAKDRFLGALAITSQNMRVLDNAKAAVYQYKHKAKHGKFDYEINHGEKAPAITKNLRAFDLLEAKLGDKLPGFFDADFTVRELAQFGKKFFGDEKFAIDGRMDDTVKGSAVFGPKIGQGFFQNLKGNYDPVTIDLWLRRTFGRLTGRSVDVSLSPKAIGRLIYSHRKNTGRRKTDFDLPDFLRGLKISGSISKDGKINYKISDRTFERLFGEHEQGAANTDAVFSLAGRLSKEWERRFSGAGRDVTKAKSELQAREEDGRPTKQASARLAKAEAEKSKLQAEKPSWAFAATSISGKLKPIDIPTPQERAVIVQAFGRALTKLRDKGYDLTPADLQATLWYPEKDIWAFLKGDKSDALNMSYDQAMEKIRDAR